MREGKGERDRRGGRRKGGQEPALPIKNRPRAPASKRQFFQYRILGKDSNISLGWLVVVAHSLSYSYTYSGFGFACTGWGRGVVVAGGGSCLQLLGRIVGPERTIAIPVQ